MRGMEDSTDKYQDDVHKEFAEQLCHSKEGLYECRRPLKGGHPRLPTNERESLNRLDNLVRKPEERPNMKHMIR